jgi:hypothetical protein
MSTHSYSRLWIHLIWETLWACSSILRLKRSIIVSETYADEYAIFVKRYGLEWRSEETIEMVTRRVKSA